MDKRVERSGLDHWMQQMRIINSRTNPCNAGVSMYSGNLSWWSRITAISDHLRLTTSKVEEGRLVTDDTSVDKGTYVANLVSYIFSLWGYTIILRIIKKNKECRNCLDPSRKQDVPIYAVADICINVRKYHHGAIKRFETFLLSKFFHNFCAFKPLNYSK